MIEDKDGYFTDHEGGGMSRSRWICWMVAALVMAVAAAGAEAVNEMNVTVVGHYDTAGHADGITVSDNYAYVADGRNGLVIVDVGNPEVPVLTGCYATGNARDVFVSGNYAYVADGYDDLLIVDVSNPKAPVFAGCYDTEGDVHGVFVSGNYAYVADGRGSLVIVDVSNPKAPVLVEYYDTEGDAYGLFVSGDYAYVADGGNGLVIVDVSNREIPVLAGRYDTGDAYGVFVSGNYAYVADIHDGLLIVDVSNPKVPVLVGRYYDAHHARDVFVSGNYAYVAAGYDSLLIVDISNPKVPMLAGRYGTPRTAGQAHGVFVSGNYVYVADWGNGLVILCTDMSGIDTTQNPSVHTHNSPNGFWESIKRFFTTSAPSAHIINAPSSVRGGEDMEVKVGWNDIPAGWKLSVELAIAKSGAEADTDKFTVTRTVSGNGEAVFKLNVHPVRETYNNAKVSVSLRDKNDNWVGIFANTDITILPASTTIPTIEETQYEPRIEPIFIDNYAFTPRNPTICASEVLNWINIQKSPVTNFILVSEDSLWENQTINYGKAFEYRFNKPGNYTYYCPGYESSMRGTVTVLDFAETATPSVHILDSPSSVRGGEDLEVKVDWNNIPTGWKLIVGLEKSKEYGDRLTAATRTVSGSGEVVFKLNVYPVRKAYNHARIRAYLIDDNYNWVDVSADTAITVLPASTSTSMLALGDSATQMVKLAGSALLLVAIVLFARKLYGKRKKVSEKPSASMHKPAPPESLPPHKFTPRQTTPTAHFTTLRTIWDPLDRDFVWDARKPDEYGELPRIKRWIEGNNPNIYWFLLKIVNHRDHPVTEWNIALYTEQALTITEAHIDERRVRIVKSDFDTDNNRNVCVVAIPPELGVSIPANGGRRSMYFKIDIRCEDALKMEFGVSGVVRLGTTPQIEVPIREKRFTYACKYGDFRNMYYGSIDALASMAITNLQDSYSREIVQNFTNSFRLIREFEKYCNDRHAESEVLIEKLEVVHSSLKAAEPITKDEILPLIEENLAALRMMSGVEAQKERGIRMCERLVELLHIAISRVK